MQLVGIRNVRYNRKSDNLLISGAELNFTEPISMDQGNGLQTQKFFVNDETLARNPMLVVGEEYKVYYNRFGRIDAWTQG